MEAIKISDMNIVRNEYLDNLKRTDLAEYYKYQLNVVKDLVKVREAKILLLKEQCSNAIYAGFESDIVVGDVKCQFGFNANDQLNLNSQLNKLNLWKSQLNGGEITKTEYDSKFPINWKTTNLGVVQLTEQQFITVSENAETHFMKQQTKYWQLEYQVANAKDINAVDEVKW